MKTTSHRAYAPAIRLTALTKGRNHASLFFDSVPASAWDIGRKVPRFIPGRIGKQVRILCGSAAVTGDESLISATARKRGKARRVERPRSQKTCFSALIKSRAVWSGRLSRHGQDGSGVLPAWKSRAGLPSSPSPAGNEGFFMPAFPASRNSGPGRSHCPESRSPCSRFPSADSTGAPSFSFPSHRSRSRSTPRRLLRARPPLPRPRSPSRPSCPAALPARSPRPRRSRP